MMTLGLVPNKANEIPLIKKKKKIIIDTQYQNFFTNNVHLILESLNSDV